MLWSAVIAECWSGMHTGLWAANGRVQHIEYLIGTDRGCFDPEFLGCVREDICSLQIPVMGTPERFSKHEVTVDSVSAC